MKVSLMKHSLPLFSLFVSILFCLPLHITAAQSGSMLANSCAACHGTNGKTVSNMPGLTKLSATEIFLEMQAFRSGERQSTVMGRIAKGFNDKQLKAMSDYLGVKK